MCHIVLLAPLFGVFLFWLLPTSVAAPVYAVIFLLSILLYVITIRTMRSPHRIGRESLFGKTGQIIEVTSRRACVRIDGEIWEAASSGPLEVGERVKVVSQDGMMLGVQRLVTQTHRRNTTSRNDVPEGDWLRERADSTGN
jgi:membrane-bound serine protease (ClpP class)